MKILLDECITKRLTNHLNEFEVYTVIEMGWSGIKNGKLMTLCVEKNLISF
jgi:predicted nuclease of predicted toxin-antitoxin system